MEVSERLIHGGNKHICTSSRNLETRGEILVSSENRDKTAP